MAILIDSHTRALIQAITGSVGAFQTKIMMDYGTEIVAGVTPGKGGQDVHGVPVFNFVEEAVARFRPNAALSFVPARFVRDAAIEVIDAGIPFLAITAEGVPTQDMMMVIQHAKRKGTKVLGPDTPGLISPGKSKLGVHPNRMFMEGPVGVISKSGALSYEVCKNMTENGIGQSTVVGIGGGPLWGMSQAAALEMFQEDPETEIVVLLGEVGGTMEQEAAAYMTDHIDKPVIAMIVGRSAPPGTQMGHAGAIIEGEQATAKSKIEALRKVGAIITHHPAGIVAAIKELGVPR